FIDIERSAVIQNEPNVVVAAEGMVPREPIADYGRFVIHPAKNAADDLLITGEHPLRVFDTFGSASGTGSEQNLRDRVGRNEIVRAIDIRSGRGRSESCIRRG